VDLAVFWQQMKLLFAFLLIFVVFVQFTAVSFRDTRQQLASVGRIAIKISSLSKENECRKKESSAENYHLG
jgi:hypothetical protein